MLDVELTFYLHSPVVLSINAPSLVSFAAGTQLRALSRASLTAWRHVARPQQSKLLGIDSASQHNGFNHENISQPKKNCINLHHNKLTWKIVFLSYLAIPNTSLPYIFPTSALRCVCAARAKRKCAWSRVFIPFFLEKTSLPCAVLFTAESFYPYCCRHGMYCTLYVSSPSADV